MIKGIFIGFSILLSFISCEDTYHVVDSKFVVPDKHKAQDDTIISDSINKILFSRLRKPASYGLINRYQLPENLNGQELEIVFTGRARTNYAHSNAYINVSVNSKKGESLGWTGVSLKYYFTDINKWCHFKDSIHLKRESWHDPFYGINTFAFLGNSTNENFDMDTLFIQIKVKD